MSLINPLEVVETNIVIHAVGTNNVCYARPQFPNVAPFSPEDQVFISSGVAARFRMLPGDMFRARLVPNNPEMRDRVKWRSIFIFPKDGVAPPPPPPVAPAKPKLTDEQIKQRVETESLDGRVWTTREVFYEIFRYEVDHKDREDHRIFSLIGNHLRDLQRDGKLYSAEVFGKTDTARYVYFCSSIDELTPDGY